MFFNHCICLDPRLARTSHPCHVNAPVDCDKQWPVVILSHGLYGTLEMYTSLCSQIASFGFIVIAIEHEDGSAVYASSSTSKSASPIYFTPIPDTLTYGNRKEVVDFWQPFLNKREKEMIHELRCLPGAADKDSICTDPLLQSILTAADKNRVQLMGHSFGGITGNTHSLARVSKDTNRETREGGRARGIKTGGRVGYILRVGNHAQQSSAHYSI